VKLACSSCNVRQVPVNPLRANHETRFHILAFVSGNLQLRQGRINHSGGPIPT